MPKGRTSSVVLALFLTLLSGSVAFSEISMSRSSLMSSLVKAPLLPDQCSGLRGATVLLLIGGGNVWHFLRSRRLLVISVVITESFDVLGPWGSLDKIFNSCSRLGCQYNYFCSGGRPMPVYIPVLDLRVWPRDPVYPRPKVACLQVARHNPWLIYYGRVFQALSPIVDVDFE